MIRGEPGADEYSGCIWIRWRRSVSRSCGPLKEDRQQANVERTVREEVDTWAVSSLCLYRLNEGFQSVYSEYQYMETAQLCKCDDVQTPLIKRRLDSTRLDPRRQASYCLHVRKMCPPRVVILLSVLTGLELALDLNRCTCNAVPPPTYLSQADACQRARLTNRRSSHCSAP